MTIIIEDSSKDYTEFIAKTLDALSRAQVAGIALVALINDTEELTAYWNMGLRDKLQAENALRFDAFDTFLLNNVDRYAPKEGDE